ncbi:MAG: DUF4423 domain-containing protein, partial [Bdellovibrionales bacterium]|nr:DUF4423 domain-containing protein [Bdellovibrionales bacterium]
HSKKPKTSLRSLSKQLGYSSDRSLGMVVKGQRMMSEKMKEKITQHFNFTPKEITYLTLLVKKEKSSNPKEIQKICELLEMNKPGSENYVSLSNQEMRQMTKWYFFVIIELIEVLKENATLASIIESLEGDVSEQDIEICLATLEKLKYIYSRNNIYIKNIDGFLKSSEDVPSASIQNYHIDVLTRAQLAIESRSVLDREFISKTITIDMKKLPLFKKKIRESFEELSDFIIKESSSNSTQKIYQLSVQFFDQISKKIIDKNDN